MEKVIQLPQGVQRERFQANVTSSILQRQNISVARTQKITSKTTEKVVTKTKGFFSEIYDCYNKNKIFSQTEKVLVQDIFAQVDEELQKRKANNLRLQEEISDRENQLLYLQQQTKDQSALNASYSVSLSVTENNLRSFEAELKSFIRCIVKEANEIHTNSNEEANESKSTKQICCVQLVLSVCSFLSKLHN